VETAEEDYGSNLILMGKDDIAAGEKTSENFVVSSDSPLSTVSGLGLPPSLPPVHLAQQKEALDDGNSMTALPTCAE